MRVLHVTDTHLGAEGWYRGAPRGWRRADDHHAVFRAALAPVFRGEVDLVLHTGDLFDRSRPPAQAVTEAESLFTEVGRVVPVVVMPGNHDRHGLRGHFPRAIPGVQVLDTPTHVTVAGVRIGVVPFFRDATAWATAAAQVCRDGVDMLLAHQAFAGSRVPGHVFAREPDTIGARHIPPGVRWILCGHIHPRQSLGIGGATVLHPGSTERTAFSERYETKGVLRFDLGGTWRFEDLPARPMVYVETAEDLDAIAPEALVRLAPEARTHEIEAAALARGGWVAPWAAPSPQLRLFA